MLFVVFEGLDKTGKSTHATRVASYLRRKLDQEVVLTREPGGCAVGEKLRRIMMSEDLEPKTEVLMMFAARYEHLHHVIWPALKRGAVVLCDRFVDSTYVYQGYVKGVPTTDIARMERFVCAPKPDMVFFFSHTYQDVVTDRLEDVDRQAVLGGYHARMDADWIAVPRETRQKTSQFVYQKIIDRLFAGE